MDSLLDYARIQSGRMEIRLEALDLRALIRAVADEMSPQAEQKQLVLETVTPEDFPSTRTDPQLVHLMLVNLVANAIKFTQAGRVCIHLEAVGDRRLISVRDTGPGIPEHERARIFEPFEQLESVRRKHLPGVGLGLAIVREMAHALRGEVQLASEPVQAAPSPWSRRWCP